MKNLLLLTLTCLSVYYPLTAQMSRQEAFDIVKTTILNNDTSNIDLYGSKNIIPSNSTIGTMYQNITSPDYPTWMFFIDDDPFQNWGHPARFVFVDGDGQTIVQTHDYPPFYENMDVLIRKIINVPTNSIIQSDAIVPLNTSTSENDYAVIISGGYTVNSNYERYWNDCAAIYSTLVNVYNYNKSHIYVLMADGTNPAIDRARLNGTYDSSPLDLDGDGIADIQYAATKANITTVFDDLSNILTDNDNLFIYTTDHGGRHSGQNAFLYLWGNTIEDYEFAAEVDKINAKTINIVMEQCNSGGFIDDLTGNNRVIATACLASEYSYAMSPYYDYDEFVFHWTSAVAGQTPSGTIVDADTNNDGFVTASEAFIYANSHDTQDETPQYNSQPSNLGTLLALNGHIPIISGADTICTTLTTYTLSSGTASSWSVTPTSAFSLTSTYTASAVVKPLHLSGQAGTLTATVHS